MIFSDFSLIDLGQQRKESRNERVSTDFCYYLAKQVKEELMQFFTSSIWTHKCHNLILANFHKLLTFLELLRV